MPSRSLRLLIPVFALLVWGVLSAAQSSGSSFDSSQNLSDSQQQPQDQSRDKKKDKNGKSAQNVHDEVFSTAVANSVLNNLRDGLEGHNRRLMLSAFDPDKMDGYLQFADQIQALFNRYESFRVYFRIVQSAADGPKGVVLVDIQLEEVPRDATTLPVRKSGQLRFEMERGSKGWKIVDFNPRNFFS